jgi:hypothetical protein
MTSISDNRIMALYQLAHQEYAAAVTDNQRDATEQLKRLSLHGNEEAALALDYLKHRPNIHPFLREILAT